jgi:hypothetical protein
VIDHPLAVAYSAFMAIWPSVLLILWRRRCAVLAYKWGVLRTDGALRGGGASGGRGGGAGGGGDEPPRLHFRGVRQRDVFTGEWVIRYPGWKRRLAYAVTTPVVLAGVTSIALLVVHLFRERDAYLRAVDAATERAADAAGALDDPPTTSTSTSTTSSYHSSVATASSGGVTVARDARWWLYMVSTPLFFGLLIPLLYAGFKGLAARLTDFENHRTDSQYMFHLTLKVFVFKFFTVFTSLYYYAFLDVYMTDSDNNEIGMLRVAASLCSFMTVRSTIGHRPPRPCVGRRRPTTRNDDPQGDSRRGKRRRSGFSAEVRGCAVGWDGWEATIRRERREAGRRIARRHICRPSGRELCCSPIYVVRRPPPASPICRAVSSCAHQCLRHAWLAAGAPCHDGNRPPSATSSRGLTRDARVCLCLPPSASSTCVPSHRWGKSLRCCCASGCRWSVTVGACTGGACGSSMTSD